jgi:hypothetical protein
VARHSLKLSAVRIDVIEVHSVLFATSSEPLEVGTREEVRLGFRSRIAMRKWPIAVVAVMLGVGAAFMFGWIPLVYHRPGWDTGGDLWGIFRGAHYVAWGDLGGVYTPGTGMVTLPGIAILLAPVAMIGSKFHLLESYAPIFFVHPTVALILQPVELLLAGTVVFGADALSERLGVDRRRRIAVCALVGLVAWPVAALWGHAEDVLAMTFAMYALDSAIVGKWSRCGWLLGFGIVMQPLVALLLPLLLGFAPSGKRVLLGIRALVLSAIFVGVAFAGNPSGTYLSLVRQPTPPSVNHATPWSGLAPTVSAAGTAVATSIQSISQAGHRMLTLSSSTVHAGSTVSGGPGRILDLLLAVLLGVFVARRRPSATGLVWWALVVLGSRCFFEAVMTPYYLAPPVVLGLVLASLAPGRRFWTASGITVGVSVFAYLHLSPWSWWLPIVAGMASILYLTHPAHLAESRHSPARRTTSDLTRESGPEVVGVSGSSGTSGVSGSPRPDRPSTSAAR